MPNAAHMICIKYQKHNLSETRELSQNYKAMYKMEYETKKTMQRRFTFDFFIVPEKGPETKHIGIDEQNFLETASCSDECFSFSFSFLLSKYK